MKRYPCWRCFFKLMRDWIAWKLPRGRMRRGYVGVHFFRCFGWAIRVGLAESKRQAELKEASR